MLVSQCVFRKVVRSNGRQTSETWYNSAGYIVDTLTYAYYADGSLFTASNSAGTYTYSYDGAGRVPTIADPSGITLQYGYNAVGDIITIQDSRGGYVTSTYDANHRLLLRAQLGSGVTPISVGYSYTNVGQISQMRRYSDSSGTNLVSTTDYVYDATGNLTSETHSFTGGSVSYTNAFDALNRISSENRNGTVSPYTYDAVSEVTGAGAASYTFDANGNRTMGGYVVGTNNKILSDGTWNYVYDAIGTVVRITNIASGSYWLFSYNLNNQVTSSAFYDINNTLQKQVAYAYDVFGNMFSRTVTISGISTTTKYAYDVSGASIGVTAHVSPTWADLDSSGTITTRYLIDDSGARVARSGSAGTYWLLLDRLGSLRELLDSGGNLVDQINYDISGTITSQTNAALTGDRTHGGMRYDNVTGFVAGNYRFVLLNGQWSGIDPWGFRAGDANPSRDSGNKN